MGRLGGCRERNRPPLECECNEDGERAEERDGKMREKRNERKSEKEEGTVPEEREAARKELRGRKTDRLSE